MTDERHLTFYVKSLLQYQRPGSSMKLYDVIKISINLRVVIDLVPRPRSPLLTRGKDVLVSRMNPSLKVLEIYSAT